MHRLLSGPLTTEKLTVKLAGLPASLQGKKLVQMSDFHYDGVRLSDQMLERAIAICNQAQPDLILLTGDYVTTTPEPIHQLAKHLKNLKSNCGVYAVLGNHDISYENSKSEITNALENIGIHVLWNQIAYPLGKELPLIGLADFFSKEFNPARVMNLLDNKTPRLVLSHNPDTAKILNTWRVDLQLSGHTHGGQIIIPGFGPALVTYNKIIKKIPIQWRSRVSFLRKNYFVVRHWEWSQGLHQLGQNQLYVNRGLGTYLPGRLFCPPEVTIMTLINS
ncbi:metallophosphoesterase [Sphaerospermopsis aphanizomenoides BCCUSP55]|uniref:metallophosphoesterase n=1 Tax=Sphaerospermopsis aphanizomenoides TaxID=459663 RepID=UPI000A99FE38|nr:metallophosphoesterase [Sphaerospermopsis aphanizomenoides]MBK1989529.1 metallophosphoesterase [Sphaerospermopsis aphanizomenoides BCCUSP55]